MNQNNNNYYSYPYVNEPENTNYYNSLSYQSYSNPYAIPPYQYIPNQFNYAETPTYADPMPEDDYLNLQDYGPYPFSINIEQAAEQNDAFRTTLWTGEHLQLTVMSINVGEDIGFEIHDQVDQFIYVEEGTAVALMGNSRNQMSFQANVEEDDVVIIPSGTWHNVINTGDSPLKLFSIYAPPQHPHGTVHKTRADAKAAYNEGKNGMTE